MFFVASKSEMGQKYTMDEMQISGGFHGIPLIIMAEMAYVQSHLLKSTLLSLAHVLTGNGQIHSVEVEAIAKQTGSIGDQTKLVRNMLNTLTSCKGLRPVYRITKVYSSLQPKKSTIDCHLGLTSWNLKVRCCRSQHGYNNISSCPCFDCLPSQETSL